MGGGEHDPAQVLQCSTSVGSLDLFACGPALARNRCPAFTSCTIAGGIVALILQQCGEFDAFASAYAREGRFCERLVCNQGAIATQLLPTRMCTWHEFSKRMHTGHSSLSSVVLGKAPCRSRMCDAMCTQPDRASPAESNVARWSTTNCAVGADKNVYACIRAHHPVCNSSNKVAGSDKPCPA